MGNNNPGLTKNYATGGAVAAYRIVKFSADDTVVQGAAATDLLVGVHGRIAAASGERTDVTHTGIAEVEYGGNVTRGAKLTSDDEGKAVAAAPAQGVNNQIIGIAMIAGADGDIGSVLIAPSTMQGA